MKFWKTVRNITIIIFIIIIFFMIRDAIICMHMEYPHPILGTDAYNFGD